MEKNTEFDEIRPYDDEEIPQVIEELIADPEFKRVTGIVVPTIPFETLVQKMRQCKTKTDFQETFCYDIMWKIAHTCTNGLTLDHTAIKDKNIPYTYISNHRDIILDSGFLSILLVKQGMNTVEIAIGDNLLIHPWIKKIVRVNKSFIVKRNLGMKQAHEASVCLSRYMHYAISEKKESIWIAQREGRAKDSNDRTQDSLLKMLAMGGEGDIIDRLKSLNIVPLSISYEYDPCDYLKAMEFQLKRDDPDYAKTTQDDLRSMEIGLFGQKGRVHFQASSCLNKELDKIDRNVSKQELYALISALIDRHIHRNYAIYPGNYIACDLLSGENGFEDKYTAEEKQHFQEYINKQLEKIDLPDNDDGFLYERMLTMYANPLVNYQKAVQ